MLSGDKLRALRIMHNKTQQEIADWCNISKRYVGMVEYSQEQLSEQTYCSWLNCIYGIGKPLSKTPRPNQTSKRKKSPNEE